MLTRKVNATNSVNINLLFFILLALIDQKLSIHLFTDGHLGWFPILAVVNTEHRDAHAFLNS